MKRWKAGGCEGGGQRERLEVRKVIKIRKEREPTN
jgi:hypothetical protein